MRLQSVLRTATLALLTAAAGGSRALAAEPSAANAGAARHPNILFLVADEYRHDCLSAAGHPVVKTPNFDKLAAAGMRLTNAYVASPVCSPSRATMFTGRYPQVHGVTTNNLPFAPGEITLPQFLKAQGYTTGIVGKLHLHKGDDWFDFDHVDTEGSSPEYRAFLKSKGVSLEGQPNTAAKPGSLVTPEQTPLRVGTSPLPEDLFPEAWEADQAIDFIRSQKTQAKPFFLYLSMLKPHSEYVVPAPFDNLYAGQELLAPITFKPNIDRPADFKADAAEGEDRPAKPGREERAKAKPDKVRRAGAKGDAGADADKKDVEATRRENGAGSPGRLFISDPSLLRAVQQHYYGAVTMVDKQMGRVIDALDQAGLRDNTIIVFTADHGNMLGERNRMFKGVMYESSVRVPMLYRGPGIKPGQVDGTLLDNTSIMPTLLELAKLPIPASVQGQSIAPLLAGTGSGPGVAYSYLSDKMVRQGDWKLIVPLNKRPTALNLGREQPELYNVKADPQEQNNLYGKPEAAEVQKDLTAKMEAWVAQKPPKPVLPGA